MDDIITQQSGSEQLTTLLANQRAVFQADPMPSLAARLQWLKRLRAMLVSQQDAPAEAVSQGFGNRSRDETLFAECCQVCNASTIPADICAAG